MTKANRTNLIITILIAIVAISGILGILKLAREYPENTSTTSDMMHNYLFPHARVIQPFVLKSGANMFTDHSLKGHWSLVFFGYTHCPDICPTTLSTMKKVWETLTPQAQSELQMVFVSIDPERDTPDSVQQYAAYFNPHFIGATGAVSQLTQLTAQMGVAYFKVPGTDEQHYELNHTGSLMIFNPLGQYAGVISPPLAAGNIAAELEKIIASN